jgi:hypothetical protein
MPRITLADQTRALAARKGRASRLYAEYLIGLRTREDVLAFSRETHVLAGLIRTRMNRR